MILAENYALMEVFSSACILAEAAGRLLTSRPPPTTHSPPSSGDYYSVPLMSLCPAHLVGVCPTPLNCSRPHAGVRPSSQSSIPNLPTPHLRPPSLFQASLSSAVDSIISQIRDLPSVASLPHPIPLEVQLPDRNSIPVQSLQCVAAVPVNENVIAVPAHLTASPTSSFQFNPAPAPKNAIESPPSSVPSTRTPLKSSPELGPLLLAPESEESCSEDDASSVLSLDFQLKDDYFNPSHYRHAGVTLAFKGLPSCRLQGQWETPALLAHEAPPAHEEEEAGEPAGGGEGAWPIAELLATLAYTFDWPNLTSEEQVAAYTCFQASNPTVPQLSPSLFESLKQMDPLPPSWALSTYKPWTCLDA